MDASPGAFWIGSPHPFDLSEVYIRFRRAFDCDAIAGRAILAVTADSRYKLWINGRFVSRGPARCYPHAQIIDEIDITDRLQPGRNVIAALVYQPGYSHFAYVHRGAAGLLGWLMLDDQCILQTNGNWRVGIDESFSAAVPRVSIYSSGVEDRDLRRDEAWQLADYDDRNWSAARIVAPVGGFPWTALEARDLPYLIENRRAISPVVIRQVTGDGAPDYSAVRLSGFQLHEELVRGWQISALRTPATGEADDAFGSAWYSISQEANDTTFWLFDLGRDYLCNGWAEVLGARGGETLLISYVEKLTNAEPLLSDPTTYCRMRPTDRFTLRPGDQIVEPYALRGGRYLLFAVHGQTQAQIRFGTTTAGYPLSRTHHLEADDPLLQGIIESCETTFCACLHDGFVDSVWRESSQWVGDALPQALIMQSMTDDVRPLRQVIRMAAQGAYPDGVLPGVAPGEVHAYTVVDYNFTWVELLALHYRITADHALVLDHWQTLIRMLDRFDADRGQDGLILSQPGRRLFIDWASVSRQEPNAIYNLHYLLALGVAVDLAEELGVIEQSVVWRQRATTMHDSIRRAFWRDGRWHDDLAGTTQSQLAAALAILTGLAKQDEIPVLLEAILARSLDPDDGHRAGDLVLASPFMHHYIFEALRQNGKEAELVAIVRNRWGRWVAAGYPTTWENWSVDFPDSSLCHAFSAHPRYHLWKVAQTHAVAGLSATERKEAST